MKLSEAVISRCFAVSFKKLQKCATTGLFSFIEALLTKGPAFLTSAFTHDVSLIQQEGPCLC